MVKNKLFIFYVISFYLVSTTHQSYDVDSSMLSKRFEDHPNHNEQ